MTTHILEVAERMAERIGVIDEGQLIAEGTLDRVALTSRQRAAPAWRKFFSTWSIGRPLPHDPAPVQAQTRRER